MVEPALRAVFCRRRSAGNSEETRNRYPSRRKSDRESDSIAANRMIPTETSRLILLENLLDRAFEKRGDSQVQRKTGIVSSHPLTSEDAVRC